LRGTYRILELLDEGGMGRLYRAEHIRLNRPIAVKVLANHLATDAGALTRFQREAAIVSQLHHPHIVHILDFDTTESGAPYIVMELLQGESLAKRLDRDRKLPIAVAGEIVGQIASALNLAHQQGIVHRDLKPDNVFLLRVDAGQVFVKLLDFGISKSASVASKVTREFDVLGTPDYMAPEQAINTTRADHRADQFSLGAMTYEMLTGRTPFLAESLPELLRKLVHERPPPPSEFVHGIGTAVDQVILRAMAKDADERFASVQDFAYELAQAAGISLHSAPPPLAQTSRPARRSQPPLMASLPQHHWDPQDEYQELNLPLPEVPLERGRPLERQQPVRRAPRSHGTDDSCSDSNLPPPAPVRVATEAVPTTLRSGITASQPPIAPEVPSIAELAGAITEVRRAMAFGEKQRALAQARRAIHLAHVAASNEAKHLLAEASSTLELVLLPAVGGLQKKLSLKHAKPAQSADLTPGHFFLISRLESPVTLEELLDLSPFSRPETLGFIADLVAHQIVLVS
jgi:serine/threonine protein kinase